MNAEECTRLVSLVRSLYPAQRFDVDPQNVVNAWGYVVADVTFDEAREAVVRLARRGTQWVSPGDVRRECAAARNVLTPDVDQLLLDCREVARHDGTGRRQLHPVAQRAYDAIGGAPTIKGLDTFGLRQLRKMIAETGVRHDTAVLDATLPPTREPYALDVQTALAIEAAAGSRDAAEPHKPMPEQVRRMIEEGGKRP